MTRPTLTPQQDRVAALMAEGFSRPEIARALGMSTATVKRHIEDIGQRLPGDVSIRARIVQYIRQQRAA